MEMNLTATFVFAFITTFTPGPNNISSATMGLNHGYRKTIPYILGIFSGFTVIMVICNSLTLFFQSFLSRFEVVLSYIGAAYILYLAVHILFVSYNFENSEQKPFGYVRGMTLQLINPKVIIYGLTIFSTFLLNLPKTPLNFILFPVLLASFSFASTSTWALLGNLIRRYLNRRSKMILNTALALSLVYLAVDMTGMI
ncbi:MAG: LysE family transporter [Spirochaetales bacterium]|nr:LysE family transporter [Spirochaetales bacterium]